MGTESHDDRAERLAAWRKTHPYTVADAPLALAACYAAAAEQIARHHTEESRDVAADRPEGYVSPEVQATVWAVLKTLSRFSTYESVGVSGLVEVLDALALAPDGEEEPHHSLDFHTGFVRAESGKPEIRVRADGRVAVSWPNRVPQSTGWYQITANQLAVVPEGVPLVVIDGVPDYLVTADDFAVVPVPDQGTPA